MPPYSPFGKPLERLQPSDLTALRDTKEGWYVEYKREGVPARAFAKSLSAFANTYGGWLFVGVKEESKDNAVAGDFPGVATSELDGLLQRLRHSAAEHMNPAPLFNTQVLRGPCSAINLAAERAVVAVEIPRSVTTPHVHKDGRIYRRVADGSEPKPETDRFMLDQLWARDKNVRKLTRDWITRDPEFSKGEREMPYVRALLCVDPWRQRRPRLTMADSSVRAILGNTEPDITSISFDTVYTTSGGFVARSVGTNDPETYGLTWRMSRSLDAEIVMPLPLYINHDFDSLRAALDGYSHSCTFVETLQRQGYRRPPKVADFNFLMVLLIGAAVKYRRFLQDAEEQTSYHFKARILNAWRVVPFVDVQDSVDQCAAHGTPMLMDEIVTVPLGYGPEDFFDVLETPRDRGKVDEGTRSNVQATFMFSLLARASGIPGFFDAFPDTDRTSSLYSDLIDAGRRALVVQEQRNQRESSRT